MLIAHHTSSSCSSCASTDLSCEVASRRVVACAVVWILASMSTLCAVAAEVLMATAVRPYCTWCRIENQQHKWFLSRVPAVRPKCNQSTVLDVFNG